MNEDHVQLGQGGPQRDTHDAFYVRNQTGKRVYNTELSKAAVQPKMYRRPPRPRPVISQAAIMEDGPNRTQEWTKDTTGGQWTQELNKPAPYTSRPTPSDWPDSGMQSRENENPDYGGWGNPGNNIGGVDHFTSTAGVANGNNWQGGSKMQNLARPRDHINNGMVSNVDGFRGGKMVHNDAQRSHFQNGMPIVNDSGQRYKPKIKMSGRAQADHFSAGMSAAPWEKDASPRGRKHEYKNDKFVNIGVVEGDDDQYRAGRRVTNIKDNFGQGMGIQGANVQHHKGFVEGRVQGQDHWNQLQKPPSRTKVQAGTYPSNLGAHAAQNRRFANRAHGQPRLQAGLMLSDDKDKLRTRNLGPHETSYYSGYHKNFKSSVPMVEADPAWSSAYSSNYGREDGVVYQRLHAHKPNGLRNNLNGTQLKIG